MEPRNLNKSERREIAKLETYLRHPQGPEIAARSLAALHRAASRRSQDEIENVIGAWGLWGFLDVLPGNGIVPKAGG